MEIRKENSWSKMVKTQDIIDAIQQIKAANDETEEYRYLGVRFEKKSREVGDYCENSKGNFDRDDSREFPEYGTPEYDKMEELDGTSSYDIDYYKNHILDDAEFTEFDDDVHVYVIAGDDYTEGEDTDEWIIPGAVVIGVIF